MNAEKNTQQTRSARAVGITGPGGADKLTVFTRQVRAPGPEEVRIAVKAAAVNPTDILLREAGIGGISRASSASGAVAPDLPPPWTPGMEAAGLIEAVGAGVEGMRVGDRVMTVVGPRRPEGGAQAEYLLAPAASTVRIPDSLSFQQAAALPMNGLTALLGLELLALKRGETLAVTGGAGMLASYVIPIAKKNGLIVIADAKPEDEGHVRELGADLIVPRGEDFVAAIRQFRPQGVDGLYDTALRHEAVIDAVGDDGVMVTVRGWKPGEAPRGVQVKPVWVVKALERTDWLGELASYASEGVLTPRVAGEFPPERIADVHRMVSAGGLRGRLVISF